MDPTVPVDDGVRAARAHPGGPHDVTATGRLPVQAFVVDAHAALPRLDQRFAQEPERLLHVEEVPGPDDAPRGGPVQAGGVAFTGQENLVARRRRHLGPYVADVMMERPPVLASEVIGHRMLGGASAALHAAPEQAVPPHLLVVGNQRVDGAPEIGRSRLLDDVVVEHHFAHGVKVRMLHQVLARQATFVADRNRAVRAGLQEQLRVADAAARDHDVLRGIEVQLLRGAGSVTKAGQGANRAS